MSDLKEKAFAICEELFDETVANRRILHSNPELSFCERNTQKFICNFLDNNRIKYKSKLIGTDVLVTIEGNKRSSKTVLVRADIDALPILEDNNFDYKSKNNGIMHACGHDAHTAILLSLCKVLNSLKEDFSGTVKLVFQPGEETTGGAEPLINAGILENPKVDVCLALHVKPELEAGKVQIISGPLYASPDDFYITITGKGGHGAERENVIDPIEASAKIISDLLELNNQNLSEENYVISIGSVHCGSATNVIPDIVKISGTARSLTNKTRKLLKDKIEVICKENSQKFRIKYDYIFDKLYPPLINDKKFTEFVCNSAINSIGKENCIAYGEPTMCGEDFAYFAQSLPSTLIWLGCKKDKGVVLPLHTSNFDIDEKCILTGLKTFVGIVLDYLN